MRETVSKIAGVVATLAATALVINLWVNDSPTSLVVIGTVATVVCWCGVAWEFRRR